MRQSRVVSAAAVAIAMAAFISFGAAYVTRPIPVAGAITHPTPTPRADGNPVGFTISDTTSSLKPSGTPPSCLSSSAPCNLTVVHSSQTVPQCSRSYCASFTGHMTLKITWSDGHHSSKTFTSYGVISSP
jgi:hypothetical protein